MMLNIIPVRVTMTSDLDLEGVRRGESMAQFRWWVRKRHARTADGLSMVRGGGVPEVSGERGECRYV